MSQSKCNYDVHNKELLAIILALEDERSNLRRSRNRTNILTDNKDFVPFMTMKILNERLVWWKQCLSQFDFKIEYRPGKKWGKPDGLTRGPGYLPTQNAERNTEMK